MSQLRRLWSKMFQYNWKFGLFLILLFGIPRFILVLQTNISGGYGIVSLIFVIMWFSPLIFLTKEGRKYIGVRKPASYLKVLYSFIIGFLVCSVLFVFFWLIYKYTIDNSFFYISRSYTLPDELLISGKFKYFVIFSITGMIFSPIGEELLYRGVIHGSFVGQFGEKKASYFDSLAFAVTHLAHFGIVYNMGSWEFLPLPSLLWIICMFFSSQIFFRCKQWCSSILGAIACHAGFNVGMMYFIFYYIF